MFHCCCLLVFVLCLCSNLMHTTVSGAGHQIYTTLGVYAIIGGDSTRNAGRHGIRFGFHQSEGCRIGIGYELNSQMHFVGLIVCTYCSYGLRNAHSRSKRESAALGSTRNGELCLHTRAVSTSTHHTWRSSRWLMLIKNALGFTLLFEQQVHDDWMSFAHPTMLRFYLYLSALCCFGYGKPNLVSL